MKKVFVLVSCMVLALALAACGGQSASSSASGSASSAEKKVIKVGTSSSFVDIMNYAKADFDEHSDKYVLEVVAFDDIVAPNTALEEGSLDANFFQHTPYLDTFNKEHGTHLRKYSDDGLACVYGMYSEKLKSVDDIKPGTKVGIQNDSSNRSRALRFLEEKGIIKLAEGVDLPSKLDIVDNPLGIEVVEVDAGTLYGDSYNDVDAIVAYGIRMYLAGRDPSKGIIYDDEATTIAYTDVLVLREADGDPDWAEQLLDSLTNERAKKFIDEELGGCYLIVRK